MKNTYAYDKQLRPLPLPALGVSIKNYLELVEPLLSQEQFQRTKKIAENFLLNEGKVLQESLEEWAKELGGDWLKPLWQQMYLNNRQPLCIDVNYFIKLKTDHIKHSYQASEIAGLIICKLYSIYQDIIKETFEPEFSCNRPLCMDQYRRLFKATRIPKIGKDQFVVKPPTKSDHIIILYKNQMYKMSLTDKQGVTYYYKSIVNALNKLFLADKSKDQIIEAQIGLISLAPRDIAAACLEEILMNEENQNSFEILQDALFMVCIDQDSKDLHEFAHSLLCSNGDNRYFDKNIQLIFNQKGDFGFNIEHSGVDAGPWINVLNIIGEELLRINEYSISLINEDNIELDRINWVINKQVRDSLIDIKRAYQLKSNNLGIKILYFNKFGKNKIREMGYSADAFFHIALQVAQHRTYQRLRSTYEAVSMRNYRYGRTECCRPISNEVKEFVEAIDSFYTYKGEDKINQIQLKYLMDKALEKHKDRLKQCKLGQGIERHLFGLYSIYQMYGEEIKLAGLPEFFKDAGFKHLKYDFISTSAMGSKYFDIVGFGPVVEDGFGLCYSLDDTKTALCLTYYQTAHSHDNKLFSEEIIKALEYLGSLAYIDI